MVYMCHHSLLGFIFTTGVDVLLNDNKNILIRNICFYFDPITCGMNQSLIGHPHICFLKTRLK